ncbi:MULTISPECIES: hypothetical protein [Sphingobacterium]|uniref:Porin n=1 Tax=Sphingobacterium tenebrionis TaxID=3111775 RepID=A0ABU8I3L3_9SPHI|nr:hypothetical protein [Sphingobacterium sp. CZ-2]QBR11923.1 hypothetical protein E3D81_07015 [Sphingobacterium sp. CZ-2]
MKASSFQKLTLILFSVFLGIHTVSAQNIGLKVDFLGYADNREYKAPYTQAKTFFGATISPKLYFQLEENHRLYGGVHFNQEFGINKENKSRINPIAYYNYKTEHIDFALGFIPRYERTKDIHRMVLADTFQYDRPNLEGMYFQYKKNGFQQAVFIDWTSKQGYSHREQFIAGISGKYQTGIFYVQNEGILYHNALTSNDSIDEHIQDNAVVMLRLGLDLSDKTLLDSLTLDAGATYGFDRVRSVYDMQKSPGFIANLYLGYKRFFLANSLYLGKAVNLPQGDPFYHRDTYNRLDLGWIPFQTDRIEGKFSASFHISDGFFDNQQQFTLRYRFGKDW